MMKYKGNYFSLITMVIKKPMVRQYGKEQTKKWLKGAKTVYKQMLAETEDIGADNPMAGNIYSGFVFMAIWKAADGAIKVEDFNRVAAEMMDRPIVRKLKGGTDMNKQKDRDEMNAQFHRLADWAEAHPQYKDKTWDFHFDEEKHKDGIYYYFTRCPMETYAREHGYMEVLPVCCNLDFCTAKLRHANLYREQTLSEGGKMCDYWFVGDQVKNPQ